MNNIFRRIYDEPVHKTNDGVRVQGKVIFEGQELPWHVYVHADEVELVDSAYLLRNFINMREQFFKEFDVV